MAGAPGEGGRAACDYGRTAASGCHRSRGLCNAPQALTPALGGPTRPGNPERVDRGGGRLREKERERANHCRQKDATANDDPFCFAVSKSALLRGFICR